MPHDRMQRESSKEDPQQQQEGEDNLRTMVMQKRAMNRKKDRAAGEVKTQLTQHLSKAVKSMSDGANLFQMMVRGDGEEELQKKLEPALAEKIKDGVLDKLEDKFKETVVEVSDVSKSVASHASTVFGIIKSNISDRIKNQKDLTVLQVADMVTSGLLEHMTVDRRVDQQIYQWLEPRQAPGHRWCARAVQWRDRRRRW